MKDYGLKKVAWIVAVLVLGTNAFGAFLLWLLLRIIKGTIALPPLPGLPGGIYLEIAPSLFVLLELLGVVCFFRPISSLFRSTFAEWRQLEGKLQMVMTAMLSGLALLVICLPLLLRAKSDGLVVSLILDWPTNVVAWLSAIFIGAALPVSGEIVFRGIVFSTFANHMSLLWSVLISSVAFALIWPVFHDYALAFGIAVVCSLLYHRYRILVPSILAHLVFSTSVSVFLALKPMIVSWMGGRVAHP